MSVLAIPQAALPVCSRYRERRTPVRTVIVGVGDPPEVPYLVGPPGDRDLLVVRYRATQDATTQAAGGSSTTGQTGEAVRGRL